MMARLRLLAVFLLALLVSVSAVARQSVSDLAERLRNGEDFRVRVQAALELGKTKDKRARKPLEKALDDGNAAVRAAAAAALGVLGDKRAIAELKEHRLDKSPAVRAQIKRSIATLEGPAEKPKVLVKLGAIKNGSKIKSKSLARIIEKSSREKLDELPGIQLLDDSDDVDGAAKRRQPPVVMVTGRLRELDTAREGDEVVFSARVEYIVHTMPEQAIAGTVSGSAQTKASVEESKDKRTAAQLRRTVLEAAIASAIRRAPDALLAAAK